MNTQKTSIENILKELKLDPYQFFEISNEENIYRIKYDKNIKKFLIEILNKKTKNLKILKKSYHQTLKYFENIKINFFNEIGYLLL